ncbi:hypothetical protein ADUPG1_007159 [Aduncisulcus paluster]|uniref:Uncharacterized protein n=1 Tax=Aduncisulcus paluster TaxID=2918883 RepID=A0ABQ5KQD0_9EUKA|nr:hypothetical protein ADUPG1_007159 [Aduncisulcus paluster]
MALTFLKRLAICNYRRKHLRLLHNGIKLIGIALIIAGIIVGVTATWCDRTLLDDSISEFMDRFWCATASSLFASSFYFVGTSFLIVGAMTFHRGREFNIISAILALVAFALSCISILGFAAYTENYGDVHDVFKGIFLISTNIAINASLIVCFHRDSRWWSVKKLGRISILIAFIIHLVILICAIIFYAIDDDSSTITSAAFWGWVLVTEYLIYTSLIVEWLPLNPDRHGRGGMSGPIRPPTRPTQMNNTRNENEIQESSSSTDTPVPNENSIN